MRTHDLFLEREATKKSGPSASDTEKHRTKEKN